MVIDSSINVVTDKFTNLLINVCADILLEVDVSDVWIIMVPAAVIT